MIHRLYTVAWLAAVAYVLAFVVIMGNSPAERGTGFLILLGLLAFRFVVRVA